jgi:molybdopterin/thiamine biosynthesis adenylyltransferase
MLLSHKNKKMPWQETRQVLSSTNIAVAGCSVGNSIIHGTVMDLRPKNIKIADKSLYKMENINRVRLGYWEIVEPNSKSASAQDLLLKNKANVTASQLYAIDPYINVFIYNEGINENNISRFLKGGGNEPAADFLVEEVDDPRVKVLLRTYAKKYRIPLLMVTDLGSSIQLDILRFDQNSKLPLTFKNTDAKLIKSMETVYEDPGNRKTFFNFVDQLIGRDYRQDELKEIIEQKTEIPTSTIIPQLGSTIMAAGGIMAEAIARIRLGYNYPPRLIFNKHTFKLKIYR